MGDIATESYRAEIERLLGAHGLPLDTILYVEDIQAWCRENGLEEHDPWRAAKTVYPEGGAPAKILLAKTITRDMTESVISAMWFRGFDDANRLLEDDLRFLRHLVLHEIRHALNRIATERACDEWAFAELAREEGSDPRREPPGSEAP